MLSWIAQANLIDHPKIISKLYCSCGFFKILNWNSMNENEMNVCRNTLIKTSGSFHELSAVRQKTANDTI